MPRLSTRELGRYLLHGELSRRGCLRHRLPPTSLHLRPATASTTWHRRPLTCALHTTTQSVPEPQPPRRVLPVPLRKRLTDEKKARKKAARGRSPETVRQHIEGWELSVAATVHARLAAQTLVPAVRAALALNCKV